MGIKKWEVKLCYSGYITIEVEAENKEEAWDKAIALTPESEIFDAIALHNFYPHEESDLIAPFLDSLERWPDADMINKIDPDDGTNGQDRKSYKDDQNRESYGVSFGASYELTKKGLKKL